MDKRMLELLHFFAWIPAFFPAAMPDTGLPASVVHRRFPPEKLRGAFLQTLTDAGNLSRRAQDNDIPAVRRE